jgi:hypothetical protein
MVLAQLWKVTSGLERKPGSEGALEGKDMLLGLGDIRSCRAPMVGREHAALSVTD